jgi:cytochrome c oxidase subunit II
MARVLCLLAALALASCSGTQSALNPAGPAARQIAQLTWTFFAVCGVVYVLTLGAAFWALARRRRDDDTGPQASRRLQTVVTAASLVTVLTLIGLTAASVASGHGLTSPSAPGSEPSQNAPGGSVTVDVYGHQWWWDFRYQGSTAQEYVNVPNELHIPAGVPVVLNVTSRDVIHSFWVPNLHGKRDLVPGFSTKMWIQADQPGVYRGQCAEFCGHQHAHMAFLVIAQPLGEFQSWLEAQRRAAAEPADSRAQRGRQVFESSTCVMCHTVRGTAAGSRFGPELTHLAARRTIAAGTLPMTAESLTNWVRDPQAIKPGTRMPQHPFSDEDLAALVAYLETLK